jgi:hypothetical protein
VLIGVSLRFLGVPGSMVEVRPSLNLLSVILTMPLEPGHGSRFLWVHGHGWLHLCA